MTRPDHRRAELIGGPLHGCQARVYPDAAKPGTYGGTEPATLTLCLGAALPDWTPTAWVTYHRHPDGTYHATPPAQEIPA